MDDQGWCLDVWKPVTPAGGAVDGDGMVEAVAEDVGRPADLLLGDLTASGLVERICALEHAILGDPSVDCCGRVVPVDVGEDLDQLYDHGCGSREERYG